MARALAADPPVLLMDEPFGAVDPIVRLRLQDELLQLQRELKKTIVFVTHDIDEAIRLGDRMAVLNVGGVLEQYGPPVDVLAAPANPFVLEFLGADRELKRLGADPGVGGTGAASRARPSTSACPRRRSTRRVVMRRETHRLIGRPVLDDGRPRGWITARRRCSTATADARRQVEATPQFAVVVRPTDSLQLAHARHARS